MLTILRVIYENKGQDNFRNMAYQFSRHLLIKATWQSKLIIHLQWSIRYQLDWLCWYFFVEMTQTIVIRERSIVTKKLPPEDRSLIEPLVLIISDVCESVHITELWHPAVVVLRAMRKQAEQVHVTKSLGKTLPWAMHQILPSGSCTIWLRYMIFLSDGLLYRTASWN